MTEYDAIAREYRESKRLPFREHAERYTLFELLQFGFDNFYLKPETHAAAFERAGFRGFGWIDVALHPDADNGFWGAFMANPPIMAFEARR